MHSTQTHRTVLIHDRLIVICLFAYKQLQQYGIGLRDEIYYTYTEAAVFNIKLRRVSNEYLNIVLRTLATLYNNKTIK